MDLGTVKKAIQRMEEVVQFVMYLGWIHAQGPSKGIMGGIPGILAPIVADLSLERKEIVLEVCKWFYDID